MVNNNCKYRVLHIFSSYGGGIASLIYNLVDNKTEDIIFDTLAFSYENGKKFVSKIEENNGVCYTMPRIKIEGIKKFIKYISSIFRTNKYDVIHCHISGWMALPFEIIARKNNTHNIIIHAHTTRYDSRLDRISVVNKFNQWCNFHFANTYMTCSDLAEKYIFGEKYLKRRKSYFIPNGINKELFKYPLGEEKKKNIRSKLDIKDDEIILMHVGRFSYPKNHEFLLKIAHELKKDCFKFKMILLGDGERLEEIKKIIYEEKLEKLVLILGRQDNVAEWMQLADTILLPSFNEGLPTVAIEAQAAGTQIILSDTITRQCDLKFGLVHFLSIQRAKEWKNYIENNCTIKKYNNRNYIDEIENKGFTSNSAGKNYCKIIKENIIDWR